jgi:hypothetical protein
MQRTLLRVAMGFVVLLTACSAPNQHAFEQYSSAVKNAGDSLDKVLVQETEWSRDEYVDKVLKGSVTLEDTALLDSKAGQFTVTFPGGGKDQPTFYKLQDARVTLTSLNQATGKYVTLLAVLASKELIDPDTFATIAKDTDSSLNSIAAKMKVQGADVGIHIFAVGSSEVMRLLIEHRRRAALEKVLIDNQAALDAYCISCVRLLKILDYALANDYSAKAQALERKFADLKGKTGDLSASSEAKGVVEAHLQLNADYVTLVQSLKSAKQVYTKLPEGHRELLHSVQKKASGFAAIQALAEEGQRLKTIYDQLQKPSAPRKTAKTATNEG